MSTNTTRLAAMETRLFFREPTSWIFALLFPPVILVIFGAIPDFREPEEGLGGLRVIDLYVPIVVAIAVTTLALTSLPQQLASHRERGVLRRMRTTPVQPVTLLGAMLAVFSLMSVVTVAIVLAIGYVVFGVRLPLNPVGYTVAFLLTATAMLSLGLLVSAVARSGTSANAFGLMLFFPLAFFAGLWLPRDSMADELRTISDFTPLGAGVQSLQDAAAGDWPQVLHLLVMAGWTIAASAGAARFFRWE
jgi:ABC-2 type transport system permease protein